MDIPRKNEFISPDTKREALDKLIAYLYNSRHCLDVPDDVFSEYIIFILEGKVDLAAFFDDYAEIIGHEKEFLEFWINSCKVNEKRKNAFCGNYNCESISLADDEQSEDETISSLNYSAGNGNMENLDPEDIEKIEYTDWIKQQLCILMEKIKEKDDREISRFKVAFLSIQNTLAVDARKAPSDMTKSARKYMQDRAKRGKMSYFNKKNYLRKILYPSGFWQKFEEVFGGEITNKDHKKQKAVYKVLLKKAAFCNPTRDKEKMATIVDDIFSEYSQENKENIDKVKDALKKDIKNFLVRKTLASLPKEALSVRDESISDLKNKRVCKEFIEIISLLVREKLTGVKLEENPKLQSYLIHRRTCPKCRKYEDSLKKAMEYRFNRMKELEKFPIFPYHNYCEDRVKKTIKKDLARYYEKEYEHNPCDMNLYYLLLAYKQGGFVEKARRLYFKVKELPEYKLLLSTGLDTELRGV